ncbi:MAG: signal peptide peptidase SppA [Candidatus Promineifilaceae bacterium]|nr:signal peptide peptidase SppA [Candidatus Promineifilaceae bacterium]
MEQEAEREAATGPSAGARSSRSAWWVLLGIVLGVLLPAFSCVVLSGFSFFSLAAVLAGGDSFGGIGPAVAIIRVEGIIVADDDPTAGAASGVIIEELERAAADPTVQAIVLRVDSPGGTVTGSAQIYEAIVELEKPVVVSMGATAASGGYYISAPADVIVARPDTITGSIGVIYTLFNVEELLDELGVDVMTIASGPNKDLGSLWEDPTEEEVAIFASLVEESFERFVEIIAAGRAELDEAEVRELADGRIYSGRQALALGLVDELGNLDEAIEIAAELGGIEGKPRIVEYERIPSFGMLFSSFLGQLTRTEADRLIETVNVFAAPTLQYRYMGPGLE